MFQVFKFKIPQEFKFDVHYLLNTTLINVIWKLRTHKNTRTNLRDSSFRSISSENIFSNEEDLVDFAVF